MRLRALLATAAFASLASASGCAQILGVDKDYEDVGESAGPVGAGGSAGVSGASSVAGSGGSTGGGGHAGSGGGMSGSSGQSGASGASAGSGGSNGGAAGAGGAQSHGGAGHSGVSGMSGSGGSSGSSGGASAGAGGAGGAGGASSAAGCGGASMSMCGSSCVDTDTDANDCGMCDHACSSAAPACVGGVCVACVKDKDCPAMVCEDALCKSDNTCDYKPKAMSSACSVAGTEDVVCDGEGHCVECVGTGMGCHDDAPSTCVAGQWMSGATCVGTAASGANGLASPVCNAGACRSITQLTAGDGFTCALLGDATVRCWGRNDAGQLGVVGDSTPVPTDVGLTGVQAIAAGQAHACALLMNGSVTCWGTSSDGQTGVMSATSIPPTVVAGLGTQVTKLAAGDRHTCALVNKAVWCWGANDTSQLGTSGGSTPTPVQPTGSPNATAIALGAGFTCFVRTNGTQVDCFGANDHGQLGTGSSGAPVTTPSLVSFGSVAPNGTVLGLVAGGAHACVLLQATPDEVACWGEGSHGELGTGSPTDQHAPAKAKVGALFVQMVLAGLVAGPTETAVFVGPSTANELFTWGENAHGQLGLGDTNTPVETPSDAGPLTSFEPIAMGASHTCYLVSKGTAKTPNLYCMGDNTYGALGVPMSGDVTTPVAVQW